MKQSHIDKFNAVYGSFPSYYGTELRPEFTLFFAGRDLSGTSALDLGCGEGRYSNYLAEKGCRITAVDRSEAGLEKLKRTAADRGFDIDAMVMDIGTFPFAKNAYDIVVAATILDHLPDVPRLRVAGGISSALKPGGVLYANAFTTDDPGYRLQCGETDLPADTVSDTAECMEHYFKRGELVTLFSDLEVLFYYEGVEPDNSHGRPHHHGWACLLGKKPVAT